MLTDQDVALAAALDDIDAVQRGHRNGTLHEGSPLNLAHARRKLAAIERQHDQTMRSIEHLEYLAATCRDRRAELAASLHAAGVVLAEDPVPEMLATDQAV